MPGIAIDESRVGHIFRDADGHFRKDTDANRRLLIEVASRATNFLGADRAGNDWYAEDRSHRRHSGLGARSRREDRQRRDESKRSRFHGTATMKKKLLSSEQAFRAMFVFLDEYHQRTAKKAELGDVLGDIQLNESDGRPADPAAWDDWLSAIEKVLADRTTVAGQ
jgi:hypothetical protein